MTHSAPSGQLISRDYVGSDLDGYYASDLEGLILRKRPALWCHGHIHTRRDYRIGDMRVICNPAGYEGRDHDPKLLVELP